MRRRGGGGAVAQVLLSGLLLALTLTGATTNSGGASAASDPACVVGITQYAFHPSSTSPDGSTVLRLVARNCTNEAQRVTFTQYGHEPQGCPVIDPLSWQATIAAHGEYVRKSAMTAPTCEGTEVLSVSVTDASTGTQLGQRTATLRISD